MTIFANVAGMFYPADPEQLRNLIDKYLVDATTKANLEVPKAIIAPHAGYVYSGPVAASAFACLTKVRSIITRVVLVAPAHQYAVNGVATTNAKFFATPLGTIPIDHNAVKEIITLPKVKIVEDAFSNEHAVEVELPFLQTLLDSFHLVPLLAGFSTPEIVANVLEKLWGDRETLIVISSDLSHYNSYETAKMMDNNTADAILSLEQQNIEVEQACGSIGIRGLLMVAAKKQLHPICVDLRNSGDTAGSKDSVVGYGAFHFLEHSI